MRLIDADALTDTFKRALKHRELYAEWELYDTIDCAPTIDAEPVVRCKECMYFKKWIIDFMGDTDDTIELHSCSYNNHGINEDGYCSRGKRREP